MSEGVLSVDDFGGILYSTKESVSGGIAYSAKYYDWSQVHTPSFFNKAIHFDDVDIDIPEGQIWGEIDLPSTPGLTRDGTIYFPVIDATWELITLDPGGTADLNQALNSGSVLFNSRLNIQNGDGPALFYDYSQTNLVDVENGAKVNVNVSEYANAPYFHCSDFKIGILPWIEITSGGSTNYVSTEATFLVDSDASSLFIEDAYVNTASSIKK